MNYINQITKIILFGGLLLLLSACANYKLEVQQGNLVTQTAVSKLQRGMTKEQVQALLGTPLMKDNFNGNRWDYVFYQNKPESERKAQNITLIFEGDLLVNVSH